MGAIAVSIFVTLVALIGVIYFKYQEHKSNISKYQTTSHAATAVWLVVYSPLHPLKQLKRTAL